MLIKMLDNCRVKILMEEHDIDRYGMPFEALNYDDPKSRAFIRELLEITCEQTGMELHDCRLMVEVVPGVSRSYYILMSKVGKEGPCGIKFDKAERCERDVYIYKIESADSVLRFLNVLSTYAYERAELYYYEGAYYVLFVFSGESCDEQVMYLSHLEEYGERCRFRFINEGLLNEWGDCLINMNACSVLNCNDGI